MKSIISETKKEIDGLLEGPTPDEKRRERIENMAKELRQGRRVTDFRFDQIYPPEIQKISGMQWTPVDVAIRAARLLACDGQTRVLDVGSGCGKFCVVGAFSSPARFIGVEEQPRLIEVANRTIAMLKAERVSFVLGNMADQDWSLFDAFYFFNPFHEHKLRSARVGTTSSSDEGKFDRYVEIVRAKLSGVRDGTRVATYHGFGGDMPAGFQLVRREPVHTSHLELWVKVEAAPLPKR